MQAYRNWLQGLLATMVALAIVVAPLAIPRAQAQGAAQGNRDVAQARVHYKQGTELFSRGDYEGAIAEFAEADNLAPSPMLEYNIALCYERLGDRVEALRRYRLYLRAMPAAQNKSTVEAKIRRLEGQLRDEAEAARQASEAAAVPSPAGPETNPPMPEGVDQPPARAETPPRREVYAPGAGASEAPAPAAAPDRFATDDPELARVAAIDVAAIRDQRLSVSGQTPRGHVPPGPAVADPPGGEPVPPGGESPADKPKKKASKPVYKQWWFWVVAGIGAIILIDFATADSSTPEQRLILPPQNQGSAPAQGGLEWRF